MRLLLTAAVLLTTIFSNAQHKLEAVDMAQVKMQVTDPSKATNYTSLLKRYEAFDTTLTNNDYRLLYYGFAFQGGYNGYADHRKADVLKLITDKKYNSASKTCDTVLKQIPISLVANYLKAMALNNIDGGDPKVISYRNRYRKLRDAILSSGDGFKCETAFKTLFAEDEEDVMYHYLEIAGSPPKKGEGNCEVFQITPTKYYNATKIYFDNSEVTKGKK